MRDVECESWVWKASTLECYLKSEYDESKNKIKCDDCVAYAKGGSHYLYDASARGMEETGTTETGLGNYTTWAQEGGIWMPEYVAQQLCTVKEGFDQPEKYNIGSPKTVDQLYECCNECAKLPGGDCGSPCLTCN